MHDEPVRTTPDQNADGGDQGLGWSVVLPVPDVQPLLIPDGRLWRKTKRSDPIVNALADRHYPRRSIGCGTVGGPGEVVVLRSIDHDAGWITLYTKHPDDGLDCWRNTMFRNEGGLRSSTLILDAMSMTAELWGDCPPDGWVTYIDVDKVRRKRDPGRCYLRAGWYRDDTYAPDRRRASLIRLRHDGRLDARAA